MRLRPGWGGAKASMLAFLAFFSAIAVSGSFYISRQFEASRQTKQYELTAIADLKAGQISNWYGDRMSGARVIFDTPAIRRQAEKYLNQAADAGERQELLAWMEKVRSEYGYRFMVLYGADGVARCTAPVGKEPPKLAGNREFQAALRAGGVQAGDLRRDQAEGGREIHFDIMIPIGGKPGGGAPAKGVWLLRIDPYSFLYPLVQSWPTPSRTAETLLVRQEGEDVLFLNELRHRPESALNLRRPLARDASLAAAQAIMGREGITERPDYRDVPTLAAMRRVAGTPWYMVAKMDCEEIYAPLRERSRMTMLLLFVLTVAAALGIRLRERRRDARRLSLRLLSEQQANELLEKRVLARTAALSEVNDRLSREIAERNHARERLQEQHLQLVAAKKMEAIGQLAGGVAHEVRNPLNAILSITEALFKEKEIVDNPEYDPYIQHIRTQVHRLARLMNDLLDLGKPVPSANLQTVPLYAFCRETVTLWKSSSAAASRHQVTIAATEEARGLPVLADSVRLEQVIFNLLENAAQHSPDGSLIAVHLLDAGDSLGAGDPATGGKAVLRIADSGRGVPADKIDRVFEPFFTGRKGGTGLGLTLARHFIESMGGSVELWNNDPPPGCSVLVRIPMSGKEI